MKIALFGSSLVSAYWNGSATYYRGILRALHARGHTATFYEPDAFERQQHRDITDPPYARSVVYSGTDANDVYRCLRDARAADLVVKASGVGVFDELLEHAVLELRRPGAAGAAACLITDAWEGIELFLEPGRECLVAENGAAVAQLVAELPEARARTIGQAALRRVLDEHTYAHRAGQLERVLAGAGVRA